MKYFLIIFLINYIQAQLPTGSICALNSQCKSNTCRTNTCCENNDPNCLACYRGDGGCAGCSKNYLMDMQTGLCSIPSDSPGNLCSPNGEGCSTKICDSFSTCCQENLPEHCNQCSTADGSCIGCEDGYYLATNRSTCVPSVGIGELCFAFHVNSCATNKCFNDICCLPWVDPKCTSCEFQTGLCDGCAKGYNLRKKTGECLPASLPPGADCVKNRDCRSGHCDSTNHLCCASNNCKTCDPLGACISCKNENYELKNGRCVAFLILL